jgi:hypothetical protein
VANPNRALFESVVRLLAPALFIATKLDAFHGRGGGDIVASHDLEDIIAFTTISSPQTISAPTSRSATLPGPTTARAHGQTVWPYCRRSTRWYTPSRTPWWGTRRACTPLAGPP